MATKNAALRPDGWSRERALVESVAQVEAAIKEGAPVLGYLYWSLLDNYEWGSYDPRFGLYTVDCRREDFRRVPTPAVEVYKQIIAHGGVPTVLRARFGLSRSSR